MLNPRWAAAAVAVGLACGGPETPAPKTHDAPVADVPRPVEADAGPLVDAGPAKLSLALPPDMVLGIAECDRLIATYISCDKLPQQSRESFVKGARQWKQSLANADQSQKDAIARACKEALVSAEKALEAVGCVY